MSQVPPSQVTNVSSAECRASKVPGILDATQQMGATRDGCDKRWVRQMKAGDMEVGGRTDATYGARHMELDI